MQFLMKKKNQLDHEALAITTFMRSGSRSGQTILLAACLTLTLTACFHMRDPRHLTSLWFYTYNSDSTLNINDSLSPMELTPANFIELRPDSSFNRDFGRFEYGTWTVKDNRLSLTNQAQETIVYDFHYMGGDDLELAVGKGKKAHFEGHPIPGPAAQSDPFSRENNLWRIPATRKETDPEIRARLLNHCHFWETYFTWALNNDLSSVDVRSTPTLIKIYGNGFTLKPFADLPREWKSYFYDAADCEKANDLMKDVFQNHRIAWANTDNKFKLFIGAFQQIQQGLR